MKNYIYEILNVFITLLIASLSFSGVAGGIGSDKFLLLYGDKAYELKEFKSGIINGVDTRYRYSLSKYMDKILILSARHKIDPVLVVSTIWVESTFDNKAVSKKGAIGLMQVMPKTNKWVFGSILKKDPSSILTEEERNLEAGIAYLAHLKKIVGNNKERVMIAYNMGPKYVLDRSKLKFNHDYYKKISKKFDQISQNLKSKGTRIDRLALN